MIGIVAGVMILYSSAPVQILAAGDGFPSSAALPPANKSPDNVSFGVIGLHFGVSGSHVELLGCRMSVSTGVFGGTMTLRVRFGEAAEPKLARRRFESAGERDGSNDEANADANIPA